LKQEATAEKCSPKQIAIRLAVAKAEAVSKKNPGAFVIGADQILECQGQLFDKPKNLEEALAHLNIFQGTWHQLISAVALTHDGNTLWTHAETATLKMRALEAEDLERYIKISGQEVLETVGAYRLEGIGATLFEKIDGDYFTVLGLPLLPLLACLREYKII
jgi:septum formation protein